MVPFLEKHGVRSYLESFPELWTDFSLPCTTDRQRTDFELRKAAFALSIAGFQERLGKELNSRGIRFLSLKGLSLSKLLHGNITSRAFGDLDLLIHPSDAVATLCLLEDLGLVRTYPRALTPGQDLALVRFGKAQNLAQPNTSLSLDLHWRLLSSWIGSDLLPFAQVWERSQELERQGLSPWRTLGNADTIVFVALHGFQDGWFRLKQLLDFALALQVLDYDWNEVMQLAGPRAVLVEMATELTCRLLGIQQPGPKTRHYSSDEQAYEDWLKMATSPRTPQGWLLKRRFWSCPLPEALQRTLKGLLTPSLEDICSVSLPPSLVSAYPLVRGWRLLTKAISSERRS
jgi:putative nucleotidyltransferase-like protein